MHDGRFIGDKVCDKTANYPDIKYCAGGFGSSCTAPSGVCEVKTGAKACSKFVCNSGSCQEVPVPAADKKVCLAANPSDLCDVDDICDGTSLTCPAMFKPLGTECRAAETSCDVAETCSGISKDCPADAVKDKTVPCREAKEFCDVTEYCTGDVAAKACPTDVVKDKTVPCREATEFCDVTEFCTGDVAAKACPADVVKDKTTPCREATEFCDLTEYCTGDNTAKACPTDLVKDKSIVCRAAVGGDSGCDIAEYCSGSKDDKKCPDNKFKPAGAACGNKADGGVCDLDDACPGNTATCPDLRKTSGYTMKAGLYTFVCNIKESDLGVNQAKTVWQLGGCTLGAAKGYTATLSAYKKLVAKAARAKKQGKVSTAAVVMGDNPYVIEMDPTTCLTQCPTLKVPTPDGTKGLSKLKLSS
ncbi:hypothetical protein MNEG_12870 [Monoraphidium neglectum]|uniref:Disintegrin domain-containing protein n=1 Tax=Monoraphidium neglectum TaxID=145388 RepID=A0A0D2J5D5_9CHLO|nr:hypothetical protein MNEG_12870 [Monoraphidium neglectum]KIY95092.1 hypothetical protein MNEG_12870 [Monoraphidium neglectum]|eukprot:XP_013894112.1 hypothetical protein MNEG_12870 [Monoraphidium neglectum]